MISSRGTFSSRITALYEDALHVAEPLRLVVHFKDMFWCEAGALQSGVSCCLEIMNIYCLEKPFMLDFSGGIRVLYNLEGMYRGEKMFSRIRGLMSSES